MFCEDCGSFIELSWRSHCLDCWNNFHVKCKPKISIEEIELFQELENMAFIRAEMDGQSTLSVEKIFSEELCA